MITGKQQTEAQRGAAGMIRHAGIANTGAETEGIGVVDFGLNSFSAIARDALDGFADQGIERMNEISD